MNVIFQNVCKQYGSFHAVQNSNLHIASGSFHFLLGPSGCGKTTTLRMLAGLEKPTSGQIFFDTLDVTHLPPANRGIGMVFQNYALWPHMTVKENISYVLSLQDLTKIQIQERLEDALSITHLHAFQDRLPGQLSGGQQQRVALARALSIRPKLLLLDEPLSNLDTKLRMEMRETISRIHEQTKITTLYVTHDQKEALSMGSMITVMHAGQEIQTGTPRELYLQPNTPFLASFIGETNLVSATVIGKQGEDLLIETEMGTLFAQACAHSLSIPQKVTLSIRPEAVQLHPEAYPSSAGKENCFSLRVEKSAYHGDSELFELSTPSKKSFRALSYQPIRPTMGTETMVYVNKKDIVVLPDSFTGEMET